MTVRTLKLLPNRRAVPRGFFKDGGRWAVYQDADEVLDYVIDWTGLLDGDTIATSTWTADGATIDSESETTTAATVWISSPQGGGKITNTIITAGGRTLEVEVYFTNDTSRSSTDYGAL